MTRQDSDYVGSIRIGGGFQGKLRLKKHEYPPDRLTEFLKLDLNSKVEFYKFCNNYQLIVLPTDEIIDKVKDEQKLLKNITRKLFAKEILDDSEVKLINSRLAKIKQQIVYPASNIGIIKNTPLQIREQFQNHHLIKDKTYMSVFASFWEDLINQFVKNQNIKQCKRCTNFFVLTSRHNRLYCSDDCANALKQARHRIKKKVK